MTAQTVVWPANALTQNSGIRLARERTVQERRWFILGAMDGLDGRVGPDEVWLACARDPRAVEAYRSGYEAGKRYKNIKQGMI